MNNRGWMMVVALLATGLSSGPLWGEEAATPGPVLEHSEELSQALRGRAAVALGIGRAGGLVRSVPGADPGVQRSASPNTLLHGVVGKSFAGAPWVLSPSALPRSLALRSGPNPFRGGSEMGFDVPRSGPVDLRIYDLAGREVRSLVKGQWFAAGTYTQAWDGRQRNGQAVPPGVYFARLRTGGDEICRRIVKL